MKKRFVTMLLVGCIGVNGVAMTGCGNSVSSAAEEQVETTTDETSNQHTVTYYDADGTTVLDTKVVEHKANAEDFTPEKDGYTFVGWFATPKLTREFDFSRAITEDTPLYAGFVSYVEDTRSFAIVGAGESELLKESNWGEVISDDHRLTKEDNSEANQYTITVELQEGDQFQFAVDETWADQRGYGYLESGMLDGKTYLKNAGGLGDTPAEKSNIEVAISGTYTFTLTTFPGEDVYDEEDQYYTEDTRENFNSNPYDKITWTYTE